MKVTPPSNIASMLQFAPIKAVNTPKELRALVESKGIALATNPYDENTDGWTTMASRWTCARRG